jgi:hypothetical protein
MTGTDMSPSQVVSPCCDKTLGGVAGRDKVMDSDGGG